MIRKLSFSKHDIEITREVVEREFGGVVFEDALGVLVSKLSKVVSYEPTRRNIRVVLVDILHMQIKSKGVGNCF